MDVRVEGREVDGGAWREGKLVRTLGDYKGFHKYGTYMSGPKGLPMLRERLRV